MRTRFHSCAMCLALLAASGSVLSLAGCVSGTYLWGQNLDDRNERRGESYKPTTIDVAGPGSSRVVYPVAERQNIVEELHGVKVADPYRWLENPDSPQSREWIDAQNAISESFLAAVPQREAIRARLTELWNFERFGIPGKQGGRYFWSRNDGLQNQSVLFTAESLSGEPRVLLDPNTLSADGTVALAGTAVSEDGRLIAYGIAEAGSDWNSWRVRDIATGQDLPDTLKWVKFSGASWLKDSSGFFYSRYDAPKEGEKLTGANFFQKLYLHRIGEQQDQNALIYHRPDQPTWGFGGGVTEDGRYLVMSVWQGTDRRNRVYVRDLQQSPVGTPLTEQDRALDAFLAERSAQIMQIADPKQRQAAFDALTAERAAKISAGNFKPYGFTELLNDFDASYDFIGNVGTRFWFVTDLDAPRQRLIEIDLNNPARQNWKTVIPEREETLRGVSAVGGHLLASYLKDAYTLVRVHTPDGAFVRTVDLPGIGSAGGFRGKFDDPETFYSFTSYTSPSTIYRYDVPSGQSSVHRKPNVKFNPDDYVTEQIFYTSKDGTRVPMFLVHKKGLEKTGNNPTLLYGYGGFNIPLTPAFSVANLVWLEMGGVYAVANIRGGGEYGEAWHKAGIKLNKQNVFDDFIAAGEWLVNNKYTQPKKLAINGGSNGGLLVGAAILQRPDLFGAAMPEVGVLDMLRFHKFTIGWAWTSDYGSPDNPEEFKKLLSYSPYHNTKPGVCYPTTLVMTADHDDRVVPAHSFKFTAALQHAQAQTPSCDNPIMIRIETKAGHGAGKPTTKIIEQAADRWAFLVRALGMNPSIAGAHTDTTAQQPPHASR